MLLALYESPSMLCTNPLSLEMATDDTTSRYLITAIDWWCHCSLHSFLYCYIIVEPFFKSARIAYPSRCSGVHTRLSEGKLRSRVSIESKWPRYWWFAGSSSFLPAPYRCSIGYCTELGRGVIQLPQPEYHR